MKLDDVTKSWLEQVAGAKIFERGVDYHRTGHVYRLEYDPEPAHIIAEVSGNYGNYEIEIFDEKSSLNASCDCPYDGYPCKHIVAVLLAFISNRDRYIRESDQRKQHTASLRDQLMAWPKEKLVDLMVEWTKQYPDLEQDLAVSVEPDSEKTQELFLKQVKQIYLGPEGYDDYNNDLDQIRAVKRAMKAVENAAVDIRCAVYWAIADKLLDFLNEYGIGEEQWENLTIDAIDRLIEDLPQADHAEMSPQAVKEELMRYQQWGNCGMLDYINDAIERLNDI